MDKQTVDMALGRSLLGTAHEIADMSIEELVMAGVTPVRAAAFVAGCAVGREAASTALPKQLAMSCSEAFAARYTPLLKDQTQEVFMAIALDTRNRPIREIEMFRGTGNSCPCHPKDLFRQLVRCAAAGVVLVHNHPSGDPEPSGEDLQLTRRMVRAGALLGITVLDHIVVGSQGFVSLASRGVVP